MNRFESDQGGFDFDDEFNDDEFDDEDDDDNDEDEEDGSYQRYIDSNELMMTMESELREKELRSKLMQQAINVAASDPAWKTLDLDTRLELIQTVYAFLCKVVDSESEDDGEVLGE